MILENINSVLIVILSDLIDVMYKSTSNEVMVTKVIQKTNASAHNVTNPSRSGSTSINTLGCLTGREKNINVIYVPIDVITRHGYKNTSMQSIQE